MTTSRKRKKDEAPPPAPSMLMRAEGRVPGWIIEEFEELLDVAEDMRGYVDAYFAEKWEHDRDLARARRALKRMKSL